MKIGIEKECLGFNQSVEPLHLKAVELPRGIELDFADHQIELITEPQKTPAAVLAELTNLMNDSLFNNKLIWPMSIAKSKQENITIVGTRTLSEQSYRQHLQEVYGNQKMMYTGIHLNFSNCEEGTNCCIDSKAYHFELLKKLYTYGPLLMQFTSFTPFLSQQLPNLKKIGKNYGLDNSISLRNSFEYGFSNEQELNLDYTNYEKYFASIKSEQKKGKIINNKELYTKIRFKGTHIELRFVDLNPYIKTGIDEQTLTFISETIKYLATSCEVEFNQQQNLENFDLVATKGADLNLKLSLDGITRTLKEHTEALFKDLLSQKDLDKKTINMLKELQTAYQEQTLPLNKMMNEYQENNYTNDEFGLRHLLHYQTFEIPYPELDMELSTKILMKEAESTGIKVDILDEKTNFIRLDNGKKQELVVQATKTNHDKYVNILAMENKYITKLLLSEKGILVPNGFKVQNIKEIDYNWFTKEMVIKPLDTNFGNGITILKANATKLEIDQAAKFAFSFSDTIIIEEYITGIEYRFLVIDGKTVSIVNRTPAQVVGDGVHTISELVAIKNSSGYRSTGYITPLELLKIGDFEVNFLKEQGLKPTTIVAKGQTVLLRKNSNVSTGGDSHEVFERIPDYFKLEAVRAAEALGVKICGVDMIIPNIEAKKYGIIEANFNPAIQMHTFPFSGQGKNVAKDIINLLFNEK